MQYIGEEVNKSALERLGRHRTFKSRALWSVRDGKGLKKRVGENKNKYIQRYVGVCFSLAISTFILVLIASKTAERKIQSHEDRLYENLTQKTKYMNNI